MVVFVNITKKTEQHVADTETKQNKKKKRTQNNI